MTTSVRCFNGVNRSEIMAHRNFFCIGRFGVSSFRSLALGIILFGLCFSTQYLLLLLCVDYDLIVLLVMI